MQRFTLALPHLLLVSSLFIPSLAAPAAEFASTWQSKNDRVWIGPEYWANPLQDWRLAGGRLECAVSGGNRNVFLLTHEASPDKGNLEMSVYVGKLPDFNGDGWAGFRLGIKGTLPDYRNAAIHGKPGFEAGLTADGHVFFDNGVTKKVVTDFSSKSGVHLQLSAKPTGDGDQYQFTLVVSDPDDEMANLAKALFTIPADQLTGHFALVSHFQAPAKKGANPARTSTGANRGGNARFWFSDWKISGSKVTCHPDRTFGPILWTQHTLHRGALKMIAFLPPIGAKDPKAIVLETRSGGKKTDWKEIAREEIDPLSRTVIFRVDDWDDTRDTPYRVSYDIDGTTDHWTGTISKDPVDKDEIVVAGFTGNTDYLFPNARIAQNVAIQNPDLLFFSGDQIYESVAGYGIQRTPPDPVDTVALDYLRKYWLFGWAFGDLMRDRPSISIPDDHDVYQGNIWGHNGRLSELDGFNNGGFRMAPEWVNMVNRTQTGYLPDPYDPTPMLRGISVYYTGLDYGRVSFAVIEDRKFKTGPGAILPAKRGRADHVRPEDIPEGETFDPLTLDVPEAKLLGPRQLDFIRNWAADWTGADFKCALSQTIFANLANFHGGNQQYLIADLDSNGWPQTGRNRALHELRRGFAFMYAGDQHLSSIVHHGINEPHDAGVSFCVPSIAAGYPRAWRPEKPWPGHEDGAPDYTGDFKEGLGNRVTVRAIGNPDPEVRRDTPENQGHDKASGHGIVRFNKKDRTITMECYRLLFDASDPKPDDQFPGWPRTIALEDNYAREPIAHLPVIKVTGITNPVIQVIDETFNEIVYTLRIQGDTFRPKVFDKNASYKIIVGEPAENNVQVFTEVRPTPDKSATLTLSF